MGLRRTRAPLHDSTCHLIIHPLLEEFPGNQILRKSLLAWSAGEVWEGVVLLALNLLLGLVNRITIYSLRFQVWNWASNLINILSIRFIKVFLDLVCWSAVACDSVVKSVVAVSTVTSRSWRQRGAIWKESVLRCVLPSYLQLCFAVCCRQQWKTGTAGFWSSKAALIFSIDRLQNSGLCGGHC